MRNPFRRISNWLKYGRLGYYPALKGFERDAAMRRLKAYEREERAACQPWLRTAEILTVVPFLIFLWLVFTDSHWRALFILTQVPGWAVQFILHRRIERRVNLKVAAERREDGRLRECVECGYDLCESPVRCPECGADVRVVADLRSIA